MKAGQETTPRMGPYKNFGQCLIHGVLWFMGGALVFFFLHEKTIEVAALVCVIIAFLYGQGMAEVMLKHDRQYAREPNGLHVWIGIIAPVAAPRVFPLWDDLVLVGIVSVVWFLLGWMYEAWDYTGPETE